MHAKPSFLLRRLPAAATLAALSLLTPGCGSGSSSNSSKPARSAAFKVTVTTPAGGASGVPKDTAIRVTFSEDIDFTSVDGTSFEVAGSSSGKQTGAYSHPAGSHSVTFAPAHDFTASETVHVRLTRTIRSASRRPLTPAELSFTVKAADTAPAPPPVPPEPPPPLLTVVSSIPRPFDLDVALDQDVSLAFSEPVDPATANPGTVLLSSESAGRLPAATAVLDDGLRVAIVAGRPFLAGEVVTVQVSRDLKAASGALFGGWTFQFRAKAEAPAGERKRESVFSAIGKVSRLLSADLNLDRRADLVYAAENETVVDVLLGRGDGTFLPSVRIDAGQPILALALADVDADGDLDILVGTPDRARAYVNRSIEEGPLPDAIAFALGSIAPTGAAVRSIAVGDLDHRGLPDVVLDSDRGLFVHLGGLDARAAQVLGSSRQSRTQVLLADLDLDGHTDLVFGDRLGSRVTYYRSTGSAEKPFDAASHVDLGTDADQIAVEDLGGDGVPEIVVLTVDGASARGAAFRILTRAEGVYKVERGDMARGGTPGGLGAGDVLDAGRFALADLDGDGLPDLLLAAAVIGKVMWFPNQSGHIDFAGGGQELLGAPEAWAPLAADLTDDGSLDIVAAGNNEIHTLLAIGEPPPPAPVDGTFRLAIDEGQARQKDTNASALVRLTNSKPLQAYSVALGYEGRAVLPTKVSTEGTITGQSAVEFSDSSFYAAESAVSFKVIVEFVAPFENRALPAGENQLLFRLLYDVLETAPLGDTSFQFLEGAGNPRIPTELVVETQSVKPEATPGKLTILPSRDPPPPPSGNKMQIGSARVAPGAEGTVPVLGTVEKNAEAFTSIVSFDKTVLEILDLDLGGSITADLHPDLVVPSLLNDEGHAFLTVLFDFMPPFEKQTIPPGSDRLLFTVKFRARAGAVPGPHTMGLENRVGHPPLNNVFVFDGQSVFPDLVAGEIRIDGGAPPVFLRGDFDSNGALDLSDAVALVNHLFKGAAGPACGDAADSDDNGLVDLTDSILLLNHLFKGGPPPAPPYPDPGTDPTTDNLGCSPRA